MNTEKLYGLWPVMVTPFTGDNQVDYDALHRLIQWYELHGANGLFAICQSSEIFYLSLAERQAILRFVKRHASVPVIASGHVSDAPEDQLAELLAFAQEGADALILITNRLAGPDDAPGVWLSNAEKLVNALPAGIPLGLYECPYPYKRLLSEAEIKWCADSGRFYFLKDTCCDISVIRKRLAAMKGSRLHLFNANTSTLLDSLKAGASGFSGVMANFHPELYAWLLNNWRGQPEQARLLQDFLTVFSLIERQAYPLNAKYHLQAIEGVFNGFGARTLSADRLSEVFKDEVRQMDRAANAAFTLCRAGGLASHE